jgi:ABC-type transport system involved in Fe-S cluster assembly fused permease/ATPase subunit
MLKNNSAAAGRATSALGAESERMVQTAADQRCRDRTTLVIARRLLATITIDHILVSADTACWSSKARTPTGRARRR